MSMERQSFWWRTTPPELSGFCSSFFCFRGFAIFCSPKRSRRGRRGGQTGKREAFTRRGSRGLSVGFLPYQWARVGGLYRRPRSLRGMVSATAQVLVSRWIQGGARACPSRPIGCLFRVRESKAGISGFGSDRLSLATVGFLFRFSLLCVGPGLRLRSCSTGHTK